MDINILGAILFFLVPGVILLLYARSRLERANQSYNWPVTEGEITQSIAKDFYIDDYTKIKTPGIVFEYYVYHEQFHSSRYSVGEGVHDLDMYKIGDKVRVFYDPDNPQYGILEPGISKGNKIFSTLLIGSGCVLTIIGLVIIWNSFISVLISN